MKGWVESGLLIDCILALTVLEWIALVLYHRRTGRGVAPREFTRNLVSGMFLLLALRQALVGAWWGGVAACLAGALMAHLADIGQRWRR